MFAFSLSKKRKKKEATVWRASTQKGEEVVCERRRHTAKNKDRTENVHRAARREKSKGRVDAEKRETKKKKKKKNNKNKNKNKRGGEMENGFTKTRVG